MNSLTSEADLRYRTEAQQPFSSMQALATQLAGLLLLAIVSPKSPAERRDPLQALGRLLDDADDQLRSLVPRDTSASHHYRHLRAAMVALRRAHSAASDRLVLLRYAGQIGECESAVKQAIAHLRHASNALSGFALVDLSQCCGASQATSSH